MSTTSALARLTEIAKCPGLPQMVAVARPVSRRSSMRPLRDGAAGCPSCRTQGSGPEHAGNNTEERGPGQPTAGKVEGKQVGPGRINRVFTFGQHRHEILIGQNDSWRQVKLRIIIGYQDIQGPSGAEVLRRAA